MVVNLVWIVVNFLVNCCKGLNKCWVYKMKEDRVLKFRFFVKKNCFFKNKIVVIVIKEIYFKILEIVEL